MVNRVLEKLIIILGVFVLIMGCTESQGTPKDENKTESQMQKKDNLLKDVTASDLNGLTWKNPPQEFSVSDESMVITAGQATDFFNNPEDHSITGTAPFLYQEITGDFVATAQVQPDFSSMWNAAGLLVYIDSLHWIKLAFEDSDATGASIVSVVTRETSDDANGPVLHGHSTLWLRIIRKGDIYALHWSADGTDFKMARLTALPHVDAIQIGVEAQCPAGKSATHTFLYFSLEHRTVVDVRKGV